MQVPDFSRLTIPAPQQQRDTFDALSYVFTRLQTIDELDRLADHERILTKSKLTKAGIASTLPLMIPGYPLVFYVGGTWDGHSENVISDIVRGPMVRKVAKQDDSFVPMTDGLTMDAFMNPVAIEDYEPAVIFMQRSQPISAIFVRVGFARSFHKRAISKIFSSEMAALLKLIVISLGTEDIRYINAALKNYRRKNDESGGGQIGCCIIQVGKD